MKNIAVKCDQRLSHSFTSLLSTADQMMSNGLNGCPASVPSPVGLTTTTTQTTLSSLALPPLPRPLSTHTPQLTVISQPLNIGQTARTTTPAVRTVGSETKPTRNKHLVVNRTNGLYEGSHIHFSPVDNKPLCSYSTKLCKQRRINGYAFCIRHILEDPSAPFRQCKHVAKYNQQKCSNAIPANEERLFCNSHMQIAGMAPKKERKEKSKEKNTNGSGQSNTSTTATNINSISQTSCGNKTVNGFKVNTKDVNQLTDHKLTNFEAFIKPPVKLNGTKSVVNANTLQKLNNNLQKKSLTIDKSCGTTAPLPLHSVAIETSDSSHTNSAFKVNSNLNKTKSTDTQKNATAVVKPKPKRKKKDKKSSIDNFVLARKKRKGDGLFNYHIWSETDESDAEIDDQCRTTSGHQSSGASAQELCPLIAGSLSANIVDLEPNELKNELLSQKWLLKNLIDIRKRDFQPHLDKTRSILKTLNCSPMKSFSYLDYKLAESGRRSEQSIRKGICCYSSDESRCRRPSLPMSRHCSEHILYNVDQCLFSRCTAKCAQTMTQCSRPTFDIINEEPLCTHHLLFGTEVDERTVSPTSDKNRKRRKTKPMALTRVSRRGKKGAKKRKGPNGTEITVIEDSIESRLSIDDDSLHSHSSTNDITINLLAQKPDHNQNHSSDHIIADHVNVNVNINAINTSIPQTTSSAAIVSSAVLNIAARPQNRPHDIPLMRLSPMMTTSCAQPPVTTCVPVMPMVSSGVPLVSAGCQPGVPIVTSVMDHSMPPPPPLEPTEEALVASIVADLPQLTTDADFTEVLNKIPDDFSDFLLEHPNGEMPTTEETEALEQALAMVNKDVQNLVAGINGSGDSFGDFGSWLGGLTPDQRQQLNGLIDGAIASNSLSPILKNACDAYPSMGSALPSSAPPILKTQSYMTAVHSSQANPYPNLHSYPNLVPVQPQEFVPISAPVPTLINNNLLINGLSSHPS